MPAIVYNVVHEHEFPLPFIDHAISIINGIATRYSNDSRKIVILNISEIAPIRGKQLDLLRVEYHKLNTFLRRVKPDVILMTSFNEPHWVTTHEYIVEQIIKPLDIECKFLGYYSHPGSTFFDHWGVLLATMTPDYNDSDLLPILSDKVFLFHCGHPVHHRVELYHKLVAEQLDKFGHISLSEIVTGTPIIIDEGIVEKNYSTNKVPHDSLTLGGLGIWKQTVFTVVNDVSLFNAGSKIIMSGTTIIENCGNYGHTFLSEKPYKPIVGLRPFILNGSYDTAKKLKDFGFDLYEDVYGISLDDLKTKQGVHSTIVKTLKMLSALTAQERLQWYTELLPRLRANKQHLFDHARQQLELISKFQI